MSNYVGQYAWHVHHMRLYETISTDGLSRRIHYIKCHKPLKERTRRLRLLKIVRNQALITACRAAHNATDSDTTIAASRERQRIRRYINNVINTLHDIECKKCPWDGHTIFPKRKKK